MVVRDVRARRTTLGLSELDEGVRILEVRVLLELGGNVTKHKVPVPALGAMKSCC